MIMRFFIFLLAITATVTACQTVPSMDAQTREMLDKHNAEPIDLETISIPETRNWLEHQATESSIELASIQEKTLGEFPVRIYTPMGDGPFGVFVFFHGGGWVFGSLNTYDNLCRAICQKAQVIVVSVGYRLAPEYPFPVPLEDCYTALKWVKNSIQDYNGNPDKIIIGGDSAGGNLTAACTLLAKKEGLAQAFAQVLIYPVTSTSTNSESYQKFGKNFVLTESMMQFFIKAYITNPKDLHNPLASPLEADSLSRLPPAYVLLANYDPLYSEGKAYAERLRAFDVPVTVVEYPTLHGFLDHPELDITQQAVHSIALFIKQTFAKENNSLTVKYTLLDEAAFEKSVVGNTVVGSTPFGKNLYAIYFAVDKTCELAAKGNIYQGTWSADVNSEGFPCVRAFWPQYTSTNAKSLFNPENPKFGTSTSVVYYQSQEYPQALLLVTKTSKYGAIVVPGKQVLIR